MKLLEHSNSKVTRDLECEHSNSRTRVLDCRVLITREYKKLVYKFRVICTVFPMVYPGEGGCLGVQMPSSEFR